MSGISLQFNRFEGDFMAFIDRALPVVGTILGWCVVLAVGCSFVSTRQSEIRVTRVARDTESSSNATVSVSTEMPSISRDSWKDRELKNSDLTKDMITGAQYVLRDHFRRFPACVGIDFTTCGEGATYPIVVGGTRLIARMDHHTNGGDKLGVTLYRPE